jgi:hypothetical protein
VNDGTSVEGCGQGKKKKWGLGAMADEMAQSASALDRVVHVTLPAEVAFDIDRFTKVQIGILGKLGCMACCSGWDIRYDIQKRFVVDTDLNVRDATALG